MLMPGVELAVTQGRPHLPVRLTLPEDEQAMAYERVLRFGDFGETGRIAAPDDPITEGGLALAGG